MNDPKRIVISRPDRIGDVIISMPCLPALRRRFPEAKIYILVAKGLKPLLAGHACIDEVLCLPDTVGAEESRCRALAAMFTDECIDTIVHLQPDAVVEQAAYDAKVSCRIGFRYKKNAQWLTAMYPYLKKKGAKHESRYAFELLAYLGVDEPSEPLKPILHIDEEAKDTAFSHIPESWHKHGYTVFHLGAHEGKLRIPERYFIAVAKAIFASSDKGLVLVGSDRNDPSLRIFLQEMDRYDDRIVNICGKTSLVETAWLLSAAAVFFSRDTGPAHLAAAVGCPTVTLFLQPSPVMSSKRWRPLGNRVFVIEKPLNQRWFERDCRFAKRHLAQLPEAEVAKLVCQSMGS